MKKIFSLCSLLLALCMVISVAAAQSATTYRDAAAWDSVTSTTNWTTFGYDVLLSQTNVTAAQLGTTNGIPVLAGTLGNTRLLGLTNTQSAFKSFLASNPVPLPYTLWARTVTFAAGTTNIVVSDWTNIVVSWASLPQPPPNLRVLVLTP